MIRDFMRVTRPWAAVFVISVALTACGDGDDPVTPDFTEETAEQLADAAENVVGPIEATGELGANLGNAFIAVLEMGGSSSALSPMLPFRTAEQMKQPLRSKASLRSILTPAATEPQDVLLPDQVMGLTFVWNPSIEGYVPDSTIAGAPANGVRFVYYELAFNGLPAQPLNPLGYVQFVDESTFSLARLEVDIVRNVGNVTLVDYYVQGSLTGNLQTSVVTVDAVGFISDGAEAVDFDFGWVATGTETTLTETADFVIENESEDASLRLDYEATTDDTDEISSGAFVVQHGDDEAVFDFERELSVQTFEGTTEGSLSFNGAEVVVFSGDAWEPEYTRPDGSDLTLVEVDALFRMWTMFQFTQGFAFGIMLWFLYLLAF